MSDSVLPRAPVIWLNEHEGVASAVDPTTGARIGPFRILVANHTDRIPEAHRLPNLVPPSLLSS